MVVDRPNAATTIHHLQSAEDGAAMAGLRTILGSQPAADLGPKGRAAFDALMDRTPPASEVDFSKDAVGGVPGWWCKPADCDASAAILYLHGGAYVVGSASAYRHFGSQIAMRANVPLFIADYRLAPEHPFPAAVQDAAAAYHGLRDLHFARIAIVGDSAGGGLALVTAATMAHTARDSAMSSPAAVVAMSPWTDLALTGDSLSTRAARDPLLSRAALERCRDLYLGQAEPIAPCASPLYGDVAHLQPVLFHVGEDEILLDDACRYAKHLGEAEVPVELHVWEGMIHVFQANLAMFAAAREALDGIGVFLKPNLAVPAP